MSAESDLKMAADKAASGDFAQRQAKLKGAVERINNAAADVRDISADMNWTGTASDNAKQAFAALASKMNQHADGIAAVRAADAQADQALQHAQTNYNALPPAQAEGPFATPEDQTKADNAQAGEREKRAAQDRDTLNSQMGSADSGMRSNVAWDMGDTSRAVDSGGNNYGNNGGSGGGGTYVPPGSGSGTMPGGGNGSNGYSSVWGQNPSAGSYFTPENQAGDDQGSTDDGPGGVPPVVGLPGGFSTPQVSVDGPTSGVVPGRGGFSAVSGLTGLTGGGSVGSGGLGGVGGLAGTGGAVAGGAGLAAGVGGLRAGGGGAGGAGGRLGTAGRFGGAASADGGLSGKTSTTGAGGRGGAGTVGEGTGSGTAAGLAGGRTGGGMMGGGGGGGGAGGGGRGGISGASSGKYGVPKLGAQGSGAGGAGGGRGTGATGAAGAGGRGGSGGGGGADGRGRDRTFLTEEDEENWYDGAVDDE